MKQVAVVILNWNGLELMKEFLPRVIANSNPKLADIVIADNGSTDNSVQWVKHEFPDLRLIEFSKNYGFADGYNKAIKKLEDYPVVILLNSDAAPAQNWIEPLLDSLVDPSVYAVQPKLLSEKNHGQFEYAGAAGGMLDKNGYPYCRGRIFDNVEKDEGQYEETTEIFWASGAALTVRREKYIEAGGLDADFFAHMEEIDLCWRLKLMGGKIVYQPKSVVFHLGGASLDASSPRKTYLNFRNNLLMLHKNLPAGKDKKNLLFRRRLLDTLAWGQFLLKLKFKHSGAIWRAHRDFLKIRKNYKVFPSENIMEKECTRNILLEKLRGF